MNVLVLGGNGYIGSKVARELVARGENVVCTKRENSDLSSLNGIKDRIKWIPASIDGIGFAMQDMHFDYVLNMVCNYGRSNTLYDDVIEANIEFPLKTLNCVVEHGTNHFLTIGTGLPDELNMYSFSKKMFSEFGRFYVEKHGICFNCLLLEMFYGADEPNDRFLPSIIYKMINGDVVETTVMLSDIADFAAMNEVYAKHFTQNCPARCAFQVAALPRNAKVEIRAVACK